MVVSIVRAFQKQLHPAQGFRLCWKARQTHQVGGLVCVLSLTHATVTIVLLAVLAFHPVYIHKLAAHRMP